MRDPEGIRRRAVDHRQVDAERQRVRRRRVKQGLRVALVEFPAADLTALLLDNGMISASATANEHAVAEALSAYLENVATQHARLKLAAA